MYTPLVHLMLYALIDIRLLLIFHVQQILYTVPHQLMIGDAPREHQQQMV